MWCLLKGCWRRLLRVPWIAKRSNQSILRKIHPEYSLEGLMLKLKLQHFGHLMWRADSLEKTLKLGKIEGGSLVCRGPWSHVFVTLDTKSKVCSSCVLWTQLSNWTTATTKSSLRQSCSAINVMWKHETLSMSHHLLNMHKACNGPKGTFLLYWIFSARSYPEVSLLCKVLAFNFFWSFCLVIWGYEVQ